MSPSEHKPSWRVEVINTGDELMLGSVLNTHHQWLCLEMVGLGYRIQRQTAINDEAEIIAGVMRESLARADLVLITGGLGPTSDDLTRETIARLLGVTLSLDAATLTKIEGFFVKRNRPVPAGVEVQALVPEKAVVLANEHGTAPGLLMRAEPGRFGAHGSTVVMLPGPTRELRPMFKEQVIPILRSEFPLLEPPESVTLRTVNLGESIIAQKINPHLQRLFEQGLQIGYCAHSGAVDIRLTAAGAERTSLVQSGVEAVERLLHRYIYARGAQSLEESVLHELEKRSLKLAVAESCTGGCIAHHLTSVRGASKVFDRGFITYSNESKTQLLGVSPALLAEHGAVSEVVARAMADGALERSGAHCSIAVTGIAGPDGGSPEKPVGTVYVAVKAAGVTSCTKYQNPYDRETFKIVTTRQALELLRQAVRAM